MLSLTAACVDDGTYFLVCACVRACVRACGLAVLNLDALKYLQERANQKLYDLIIVDASDPIGKHARCKGHTGPPI